MAGLGPFVRITPRDPGLIPTQGHRSCPQSPACRSAPGTLPQALRAGGTPTRRTGRPPAYNQYAGARPALPPALRAGGTPRARTGRRSARPTGGRRDYTDTT
ncbi:hypothetical protein DC008_22760 [Streptomyces nigra]|nr:hypothetical protein DC008_22760 [Streptomyces nigra]